MTTLTASDVRSIAALDATGQAELVRTGRLTATELVMAAIERIDALNPTLNAVITTAYEQALQQATRARGPFAGVPYLLKDLCAEAAGMRLCEGSAFLKDNVSTLDQELVTRLKASGLVMLGKTNTPEFGVAPTTEPRLSGATANPWDVRHTVGGSSGGAAAAVASGMVPMAHGNDAGGSIRIPASCTALFGLRPTRARNPLGPIYGDAFGGWVSEHALTRSVRDSAALLDATSGPALGDPYVAPAPERPFLDEVGRPPGRLRIAFTRKAAEGRPVHSDCLAAVDRAVDLLTELGHDLVERDLTELTPEVGSAIGRGYGASLDWALRYWIRELGREPAVDELEPLTRLYWERSKAVSGGEYLMAVTTIQAFARRVAQAFTEFDAWLSPTLAEPPPRLGELVASDADPTAAEQRGASFVAFPLVVANLTGAPAMSLPLHWNNAGLPIGVHVMSRYGDEATLFRLAAQLEAARPWADRWPSVSTKELSR